jgi:hypothetical protein
MEAINNLKITIRNPINHAIVSIGHTNAEGMLDISLPPGNYECVIDNEAIPVGGSIDALEGFELQEADSYTPSINNNPVVNTSSIFNITVVESENSTIDIKFLESDADLSKTISLELVQYAPVSPNTKYIVKLKGTLNKAISKSLLIAFTYYEYEGELVFWPGGSLSEETILFPTQDIQITGNFIITFPTIPDNTILTYDDGGIVTEVVPEGSILLIVPTAI